VRPGGCCLRHLARGFRTQSSVELAAAGGSSSSELEGRAEAEVQMVPDEQLYPHRGWKGGPQNLTEEETRVVHSRIARCYDPRIDGDYSKVSYKAELDAYMKFQVKPGLDKVSRVISYEMPHVWGKHALTGFMAHHWISAIIPDIEKAPSSQCIEFDYSSALNTTHDPSGCFFFRRSFEPTQKLVKCVEGALESSRSWKGRRAIMGAWGEVLNKAEFTFSVFRRSSGKSTGVPSSLSSLHAKWNSDGNVVPERFNETKGCGRTFYSPTCDTGTTLRELQPCGEGEREDEKTVLECESRSAGNDSSIAELIVDRDVVRAGQLCKTNSTPPLFGRVALAEGAGCPEEEKVEEAIRLGAVAVVLQTMPGEYYYRGERGKKFGKLLPIPTFAVSSRSMKEVVNFLKSLEKEENLTAGDAHLRIATYAPIFQEGADIVPNYAEEVKIWADAGEAVSWSSTLDRAYEIIKTVSMEKMDHSSLERAKFMVSQAVRTSMTQPLKSKFDQIDADTEEALMQCYGLSEPPTTATTTTTTTQTMTLETVEEEVEIEDELAEEVDPPDDHEADETGAGSWVQLGGGGDTACKSVSVMSSGRRKEFGAEELKNRVEFRLGGASLELNETEGIHMVTVDPDTQGVLSQSVYTRGGWLFKGAVNGETELVRDLGDLPTGTVVLIAVKGDGMAGLKEETVLALRRAGAKAVRNARPEEGYIFVGQIGGRPAAEKIGRLVRAQALLPCRAGSRGRVPERASLLHEASKCLPVMWDKVAVGGPPFPQVTDAQTDFPRDDLRVVDTLVVHPICSRFGVALNHWEMSHAPYPNPNEWAPSMKFDLRTGWNALNKGNPRWLRDHMMDFCLHPDTAVCTSYTVCWALLTRHVVKLIHGACDENARVFAEMPEENV